MRKGSSIVQANDIAKMDPKNMLVQPSEEMLRTGAETHYQSVKMETKKAKE